MSSRLAEVFMPGATLLTGLASAGVLRRNRCRFRRAPLGSWLHCSQCTASHDSPTGSSDLKQVDESKELNQKNWIQLKLIFVSFLISFLSLLKTYFFLKTRTGKMAWAVTMNLGFAFFSLFWGALRRWACLQMVFARLPIQLDLRRLRILISEFISEFISDSLEIKIRFNYFWFLLDLFHFFQLSLKG